MTTHWAWERQVAGMNAVLKWPLVRAALAIGCGLALAEPAAAAPDKAWAIDYESSLEGTTNLQQQAGGTSDFVFRNSLEFSYYPAASSDNSALFRIQALNQRYRFNPDFDSTFLIATALASHRLINSMFGYGGYQFLYKQSDTPSNLSQMDSDLFGGLVVYRPLSARTLVFHGYQFDYLRAAVAETSYQGHSAYVTLRDLTTERWINSASFRSQWRLFDTIGELEWRNFLTGESIYRMNDWWSLSAEVIFLTNSASRSDFSFNGWNFGVFTRFTL